MMVVVEAVVEAVAGVPMKGAEAAVERVHLALERDQPSPAAW